MSLMQLPVQKIKATSLSPRKLIIYSKPKVGKTSALAELPNSVILDLENGTDFLDAVKLKINNLKELKEVGEAILEKGKPYKYLIVEVRGYVC